MNPNSQRLPNYVAAAGALLTCVLCVDFNHLSAGTFSLTAQDFDKLAPASINNASRQPVIPNHPADVQAFHSDERASINQSFRHLLVHILPLVADFSVKGCYPPLNLRSSSAAFPAPGEGTLLTPKLLLLFGKQFTITEGIAVTSHDEGVESYVDADSGGSVRCFRFRHLKTEDYEPLTVFAENPSLLKFTAFRQVSVPPDSNFADILNTQLSVYNFASATVSGKCKRKAVKAVPAFESRKTTSLKKRLISTIKCPERVLTRPGIKPREVRVGFSEYCKPPGLVVVVKTNPGCVVAELPCIEGCVIQSPVSLKHNTELTLLVRVCEQSVLVVANDQLFACLTLDVLSDHRFAYGPDGSRVIASSPERRDPGSEFGKLLAEDPAASAFQTINHLGDRSRWVDFDKKVNVIRHDLTRVNHPSVFTTNLIENPKKPRLHFAAKDISSVLRAPDNMKLEAENRRGILCVSRHAHNYTLAS